MLRSAEQASMAGRELRLRPLRVDDEAAVRAAQKVMPPDGFDFARQLAADTVWAAYLQERARRQASVRLLGANTAVTTTRR